MPPDRLHTVARPTRSPSLLTQIIGRGTRNAEGKENCLILDVAHAERATGNLVDIASLFYPIEALEEDRPAGDTLALGGGGRDTERMRQVSGKQVYSVESIRELLEQYHDRRRRAKKVVASGGKLTLRPTSKKIMSSPCFRSAVCSPLKSKSSTSTKCQKERRVKLSTPLATHHRQLEKMLARNATPTSKRNLTCAMIVIKLRSKRRTATSALNAINQNRRNTTCAIPVGEIRRFFEPCLRSVGGKAGGCENFRTANFTEVFGFDTVGLCNPTA